MKISIITPVKNGERYLAEAMQSVLNQAGDFEIEYLIMDGGSMDGTLGIARQFQSELEQGSRKIFCRGVSLSIHSQADSSMYEALSGGLSRVSGEVTAYLNADDLYLPNAFACVTAIFKSLPEVKWITGFPVRYNERGEMTRMYVPFEYDTQLIRRGYYGTLLPFIQQESVFWRSDLNSLIGLPQLSQYKLAGDYFIWHSFAKGNIPLYVVESLLGGNRQREGQLSEDLRSYLIEYNSVKDASGATDKLKAWGFKCVEKLGGQSVKRRLSRHRVIFKAGAWVLKT